MTTKSKAKMKRVSGISTFDVYISNLPKGENDSIEVNDFMWSVNS